jgi:hypothetical protein
MTFPSRAAYRESRLPVLVLLLFVMAGMLGFATGHWGWSSHNTPHVYLAVMIAVATVGVVLAADAIRDVWRQ